jgi:hypothetical protein
MDITQRGCIRTAARDPQAATRPPIARIRLIDQCLNPTAPLAVLHFALLRFALPWPIATTPLPPRPHRCPATPSDARQPQHHPTIRRSRLLAAFRRLRAPFEPVPRPGADPPPSPCAGTLHYCPLPITSITRATSATSAPQHRQNPPAALPNYRVDTRAGVPGELRRARVQSRRIPRRRYRSTAGPSPPIRHVASQSFIPELKHDLVRRSRRLV